MGQGSKRSVGRRRWYQCVNRALSTEEIHGGRLLSNAEEYIGLRIAAEDRSVSRRWLAPLLQNAGL